MIEHLERQADGANPPFPSTDSNARRSSAGSSIETSGFLVARARLALLEALLEVEPGARRGLIRIERRARRAGQSADRREMALKDLAGWRRAFHLTKDRAGGPEDWIEKILLDSLRQHVRELDRWHGAFRNGGGILRRPRFRIAAAGHQSTPRSPQPPRYDPLAMTEQEADREWARYKCAARAHLAFLEATRSRRRACEDDRWRRKIPKDVCYRLLAEHVVRETSYRRLARRLEAEEGVVVTAQAVLDAVRDLALLVGISPEPPARDEPAALRLDGRLFAQVGEESRTAVAVTEAWPTRNHPMEETT